MDSEAQKWLTQPCAPLCTRMSSSNAGGSRGNPCQVPSLLRTAARATFPCQKSKQRRLLSSLNHGLRTTAWQPLTRELVKTQFQIATITSIFKQLTSPVLPQQLPPQVQQQLSSYSSWLVSVNPPNYTQTWCQCLRTWRRTPPALLQWTKGAFPCCQLLCHHPFSSFGPGTLFEVS